ncbi:MAG: hypothetical protein Q9Q40_13755 [Acidobacteriota bacterium]|nr:hypothetical protein [Acidobacteriota bacterium]
MSVRRLLFIVLAALWAAVALSPALAGDPPRAAAPQKKDGKRDSTATRTVIIGPGSQAALGPAGRTSKKSGKDDARAAGATRPEAPATAPPSTGALPRAKSPAILATRVDRATGEKSLVITNDDLVRIYGRTARPVTAEPDYGSLLQKYGNRKNAPSAAPPPRETREEKIATLEQKIDHLKRRLLSLHNPLLPRIGAGDDKEREAEKGLDNAQRAQRVRDEIRRLEQQLVRLRQGAPKRR